MRFFMGANISALGKEFATDAARVRLLARMPAHVCLAMVVSWVMPMSAALTTSPRVVFQFYLEVSTLREFQPTIVLCADL